MLPFRPTRLLSAEVTARIAPTRNWTAEYSYGLLVHPEALEPGDERRQTASTAYDRPLTRGNWATTVVWGRKRKELTNTVLNLYRRLWRLGLGADVTFYSKPSALNAAYGNNPVSFQIFLRVRPGRNDTHSH